MRALLIPEIAPRLGVGLFRPGPDILALFRQGRVLIENVPDHLQNLPSGIVPAAPQPLAEDPLLVPFLTDEHVIRAAGGLSTLEASISRRGHCQFPQGDYHHAETVTVRHPPGTIRLCWHCDNMLRGQPSELLADIARQNAVCFVINSARRSLGFDDSHPLTLPELCWWAIQSGVADLPEGMARKVLGMQTDPVLSVYHESDIKPSEPATLILQEKVQAAGAAIKRRSNHNPQDMQEQTKPILRLTADPDSPESFMLRPKRRRWENQPYLKWVKTQPCECCRRPADDPHHVIGHGLGGTATKAHDLFVFPLCRECHDKLHSDMAAFGQKHGTQLELLFRFLDRALAIGVIVKA